MYKNGSPKLIFYTVKEQKIVFETTVFEADKKPFFKEFPNTHLQGKKASVYGEEEIKKSNFFTFLWGERYREYFVTKVLAATVSLDTLYCGLEPIRKGGGHQTK